MDWDRHKSTWPNAEHSRFVHASPHHWHIQQSGTGPALLLLHGAGASTHSWSPLFAELARSHAVTAVDLPGQGFTRSGDRTRAGLQPTSEDLGTLLEALGISPIALIGHSAGAAIAADLATRLTPQPKLISINGAFENFGGIAGVLFPAIARMLSQSATTGRIFSRLNGSKTQTARLIASTGSNIPEDLLACYQALVSDADHVNAALAMMAQWSLASMPRTLPKITTEAHFIVADADRTVRPAASRDAARAVKSGELHVVKNRGHLLHEEDPGVTLELIKAVL